MFAMGKTFSTAVQYAHTTWKLSTPRETKSAINFKRMNISFEKSSRSSRKTRGCWSSIAGPQNNVASQLNLAFSSFLCPSRAEPVEFREKYTIHSRYFSHNNGNEYFENKNTPNRFDRFRSCLFMAASKRTSLQSEKVEPQSSTSIIRKDDLMNVAKCSIEILSSNRRSFNRTWKRMSPLIDLVIDACSDAGKEVMGRKKGISIADIGCDHGILSLSIACMAGVVAQDNRQPAFVSEVVGTDVSLQALENGGLANLRRVTDVISRKNGDYKFDEILQLTKDSFDSMKENISPENENTGSIAFKKILPIEFRVGDGLGPLQIGEADGIILAGMGVHTMLDILLGLTHGYSASAESKMSLGADETLESGGNMPLNELQTKYLFLQPTNSRPRHLLLLYERLHKSGRWVLKDEKIAFVGGRWYISSLLQRQHGSNVESLSDLAAEPNLFVSSFRFPGHFLSDRRDEVYKSYVLHHLNWLKRDFEQRNGFLEDDDQRWIQYLLSEENKETWTSAASWFLPTCA
ncbi:hypothetical protein ACHAXS_011936 [Conticribra weissflogii]